MEKRNGYREMISNRKEKERNLIELIGADKKDIAVSINILNLILISLLKKHYKKRERTQLRNKC